MCYKIESFQYYLLSFPPSYYALGVKSQILNLNMDNKLIFMMEEEGKLIIYDLLGSFAVRYVLYHMF